MTPTETRNFVRMYSALKEIARYQTPDQLRRGSQKEYGLDSSEALEYAYENVLETARRATKGVRLPKQKATGNDASV